MPHNEEALRMGLNSVSSNYYYYYSTSCSDKTEGYQTLQCKDNVVVPEKFDYLFYERSKEAEYFFAGMELQRDQSYDLHRESGLMLKPTRVGFKTYYFEDVTGTIQQVTTPAFYVQGLEQDLLGGKALLNANY